MFPEDSSQELEDGYWLLVTGCWLLNLKLESFTF